MTIQTIAADSHLVAAKAVGLRAQGALTVACWINCSWATGTRRSFIGIFGSATDTLGALSSTGVQIGTSGAGELNCWTWGGGALVQSANSSMLPYNGQWTFIAYSYDGTTHRLYLNGALIATGTVVQQPGYLNQIYINGYPTGVASETAAFQVGQYALYNRTLTADEILSLYTANGTRHGISHGLLCAYTFDELSQGTAVAVVPDISGSWLSLTKLGAGVAPTYSYVNTLASSNIRPVQ